MVAVEVVKVEPHLVLEKVQLVEDMVQNVTIPIGQMVVMVVLVVLLLEILVVDVLIRVRVFRDKVMMEDIHQTRIVPVLVAAAALEVLVKMVMSMTVTHLKIQQMLVKVVLETIITLELVLM